MTDQHDAPLDGRQLSPHAPLGSLFWVLLLVFTPSAVLWAIKMPKEHPQRTMALVVSLSTLAFCFVLLGVAVLMGMYVYRMLMMGL
jgi:CHASE2 domain-containing sensor protein